MNINIRHILPFLFFLAAAAIAPTAEAQNVHTQNFNRDDADHWNTEEDSVVTEDVPIGLKVWKIDQRFGDVKAAEPDTLPHLFQNTAFTSGTTGHYTYTGNLGAPRISRILSDHYSTSFAPQFIFQQPYDFFLTDVADLSFTNTKSPITNLTYHECGNKTNGEDRIRALFATNVNKRLGFGFKLDYLYGRGYYDSQSTAHFNGTLFASYLGQQYRLHATYFANHLKNTENGGIESDDYVTHPETFPTSYATADMPTRLTKTWNKLNVNTLYLTHNYSLGIHRYKDAAGNIVRTNRSSSAGGFLGNLLQTADSTSASNVVADSLKAKGLAQTKSKDQTEAKDTLLHEFIPVVTFLHTFRFDHNNRRFLSNLAQNSTASTYFDEFYLPGDSANDFTSFVHLENTLGAELREGFNRWVKAGLRLFVRHDYYRYTLPTEDRQRTSFTTNNFTVGAQLMKEQGRILRYSVLGELRNSGKEWGEFNVEGNIRLAVPLRRDTLSIRAFGYVRSEQPTFYLRHYHARNAWWDNTYDRIFDAHVGAQISWRETSLRVDLRTIQNFVYLQESQTPYTSTDDAQLALYGVRPVQTNKNIQLLSATISQKLHFGIFHWDNELTGQLTSNKTLYPLPQFSIYTNLYLQFRIAKVLHTEIGADLRFFTRYTPLTYSPIVGQYVVQDQTAAVKTGSYPTINAYANFHLKNTRFYVMASHVNYSSGSGNPFLVPHYPLNRMVLRLGISWNFFN